MASPSLQQAVASIQLNNYLCLVTITAVGYDYILTVSKEIEYIWNKRWTWVSTLFVLARYSGLCNTILFAIFLFFLALKRVCVYTLSYTDQVIQATDHKKINDGFQGKAIYIFTSWNFCIFVCTADLLMILRVRALYNQSRLILWTLLTFYATEVISLLMYYVVIEVRLGSYSGSGTAQVLQYSFCELVDLAPLWLEELPVAAMIALGALMCLLTAIRLIKELLQMHKMTKRFQLNRYIRCLVRDGMIYFIVVLGFAILAMLYYIIGLNNIAVRLLSILCTAPQSIPPVTLVPRFVLGLRELYAHGQFQDGQGNNIDTAFGFGSEFGQGAIQSMIVFADLGKNDKGDAMQIEEEVQEGRRARSRV